MLNRESCSSLILRIRNQYHRETRDKHLKSLRNMCSSFLYPAVILITFYYTNQIYNAWQGPFPMNFTEFRTYIETPINSLDDYGAMDFLRQLFFPSEYVQIELGENLIDESMKNTFHLYENDQSEGQLISVFNQIVEPSMNTKSFNVLVKFSAYDQPYWKIHYPYKFQSFHLNTLQCIVQQLNISSIQYEQWSDKSLYINHIEQIYNENIEIFNKKVIRKCGILIGYRYRPANEKIFRINTNKSYYLDKNNVRLFDASCAYTCYIAYIVICISICYSLKNLVEFVTLLNQFFSLTISPMEYVFEKEKKMISSENFDLILYETNFRNNYHDRLFIIYDKYLVMLMIDFEEKNEKILEKFYEKSPVIILPIEKIFYVAYDRILLDIYHRELIDLPQCVNSIHFNPSNWLHERLMILNEQYRLNWEKLTFQQVLIEENRSFLETLIREEIQYQLNQNRNDINRISTAASPHLIAQFRLADQYIVTQDLVGTTCTICLVDFQLDQYFVYWPCIAQHRFHFHCTLNALRTMNTCPLCRQPVPPVNLLFYNKVSLTRVQSINNT
ncbi:hypothetical protein I4U23_016074 [Adineta vaga]|nr:hypothetical protein I4U23_016074 [Adineta vaga]